ADLRTRRSYSGKGHREGSGKSKECLTCRATDKERIAFPKSFLAPRGRSPQHERATADRAVLEVHPHRRAAYPLPALHDDDVARRRTRREHPALLLHAQDQVTEPVLEHGDVLLEVEDALDPREVDALDLREPLHLQQPGHVTP